MRTEFYAGYRLTTRRPASSAVVEHWLAEGPEGSAEVYLGPDMLVRRARALPVWGPFSGIVSGREGNTSYVVVPGKLSRTADDLRDLLSPGACVALAWHMAAALAEIHERGGAHGALHPGWTGLDAEGRLAIRPALAAAVRSEPDTEASAQATDCIQLASIFEALQLERIDDSGLSLVMRGIGRDRSRLRLQPGRAVRQSLSYLLHRHPDWTNELVDVLGSDWRTERVPRASTGGEVEGASPWASGVAHIPRVGSVSATASAAASVDLSAAVVGRGPATVSMAADFSPAPESRVTPDGTGLRVRVRRAEAPLAVSVAAARTTPASVPVAPAERSVPSPASASVMARGTVQTGSESASVRSGAFPVGSGTDLPTRDEVGGAAAEPAAVELSTGQVAAVRVASVAVPSVAVPSVAVPSVAVPSVAVPAEEAPSGDPSVEQAPAADASAKDVSSEAVAAEDVSSDEPPADALFSEELPSVDLPRAEVPSADLSADERPDLDLPEVASAAVGVAGVEVAGVEVAGVEVAWVEVAGVEVAGVEVAAVAAFDVPAGDVAASELPASEVPAPEFPASEVPAPEVPAPEVPALEVPALEVPALEVPASEVPASEVPASEVPASEVPAADVRRVDDAAVDGMAVEVPALESEESGQGGGESSRSAGVGPVAHPAEPAPMREPSDPEDVPATGKAGLESDPGGAVLEAAPDLEEALHDEVAEALAAAADALLAKGALAAESSVPEGLEVPAVPRERVVVLSSAAPPADPSSDEDYFEDDEQTAVTRVPEPVREALKRLDASRPPNLAAARPAVAPAPSAAPPDDLPTEAAEPAGMGSETAEEDEAPRWAGLRGVTGDASRDSELGSGKWEESARPLDELRKEMSETPVRPMEELDPSRGNWPMLVVAVVTIIALVAMWFFAQSVQ